jgi:polyphosphate glucokinase
MERDSFRPGPGAQAAVTRNSTRVLVVHIGGTHVNLLATGYRTAIKIPSGPDMTPETMISAVDKAVSKWQYSKVSIGYPGPVFNGKPIAEPHNLARMGMF